MFSSNKAQGSFEFLIIIGGAMFFFVSFFAIMNINMSEKLKQENLLNIQKLAEKIQTEISLAEKTSNGYYREFEIPQTISNRDYNVTLAEGNVYLITEDEKYAIALPIAEVYGDIQKGINIIQKQEGKIYVNQ